MNPNNDPCSPYYFEETWIDEWTANPNTMEFDAFVQAKRQEAYYQANQPDPAAEAELANERAHEDQRQWEEVVDPSLFY
jgi:hypothetical protein